MIHAIHALPEDTQLGNYRLLEPIGRGGFGLTYMAWDEKLERNVVIKECFPSELCLRDSTTYDIRPAAPELEADYCAALESLMDEARILASQNHEHIVRVYDVFEAFGSVFYVMPYLEGGSLLARMAQAEKSGTPIAPAQVESWLRDILSALAYLHERQLFHRDIKPSNILFDEQDRPVLIDFGAALNMPDVMKTITQGVFTIAYAAPEQITGKGAIGPWTDYYALAATWYRLITGQCLERADARLMQDDAPRLSSTAQAKDYPPLLIRAIEQNLSLPITQRFQTPADWAQLMKGKMPALPKAKRKTSTQRWLIAGGVAIIALIGIALDKQEPPTSSEPRGHSINDFAARVSTAKLDKIVSELKELEDDWEQERARYFAGLGDIQMQYYDRISAEMNKPNPIFDFEYPRLKEVLDETYTKWKKPQQERNKLHQEWQQEMARLSNIAQQLSGDEQAFFLETLRSFQESWTEKYSKILSDEAACESFENFYTSSCKSIDKTVARLRTDKGADGTIHPTVIGDDPVLQERLRKLENLE